MTTLKIIMRVVFTTLLLLLTQLTYATIKVAIIDTGFCNTKSVIDDVTIMPTVDATSTLKGHCLSPSKKRLHGQRVLKNFINNLDKTKRKEVQITPIVVFDNDGQQSVSYWAKALLKAKEIKAHYLIISVALPLKNLTAPPLTLPTLSFIAGGRAERRIKKTTILWPHRWKNIDTIIIGGYRNNRFDKKSLYQDKVDYYLPFSSSQANAAAAAKAINLCHNINRSIIKTCIENKSKPIYFKENDIKAKTF